MCIVHLRVLLVTVADSLIVCQFRDLDLKAVTAGTFVIILLYLLFLRHSDHSEHWLELANNMFDCGLGIPALFLIKDDVL